MRIRGRACGPAIQESIQESRVVRRVMFVTVTNMIRCDHVWCDSWKAYKQEVVGSSPAAPTT